MKAGTISLGLWHIEPGHHREVCRWHDADHKPEVLGTTPNVFISQRWVATPEMVAARSTSRLPFGGGEYVNQYWTTGTPDQLGRDFQELGARLTEAGRMEPNKYIQTAWRTRTRPGSIQARSDQLLSAEAVTASPVNTGLLLVIVELLDGARRDDYVRWYRASVSPADAGGSRGSRRRDQTAHTSCCRLLSRAKVTGPTVLQHHDVDSRSADWIAWLI